MRARMWLAWLVAVLAWLFHEAAGRLPTAETAEARPAAGEVRAATDAPLAPPLADLPAPQARS